MKRVHSSLLVVAVAVVAFRCSDPGAIAPDEAITGSTLLKGIAASNPHTTSVSGLDFGGASISVVGAAEIAYLSLAPNTLPDAIKIEIENRTQNLPLLLVPVVDGGFDPVPVQARVGDTLILTASTSNGRLEPLMVKVPAKRPPSVVRSNPPKGRTDVALNVMITVIFTEPVDQTTVNGSSIQLLRDGSRVSGKVFQNDSWNAEFLPDTPLDPESTYELVVTTAVHDLDGEALDVSYSSTFVTGTTSCAGGAGQAGCGSSQTAGNRVITGVVTEQTASGPRPVPNAMISVWVQLGDWTGYSLGQIQSDADGKYSVASLPTAMVQLHATVAGFDQPCAVVVWTSEPTTSRGIELVTSGSPYPETMEDRTGPLAALGITLWGFVYEELGGRQPVPGARIYFEAREGVVAATATSDAKGHFALCRLPNFGQQTMSVVASGYETDRFPMPLPGPAAYGIWMPLHH